MLSEPLVVIAQLDPAFVAWFLAGAFVLFVINMIPRDIGGSKTKRIVLVDDDPDVLRGLRWLIEERTDYRIVGEARTGTAALDVVGSVEPDVVVIDVRLPEIDGIAATRSIKTSHPKVAVVAYSSIEDDATGTIMLAAGATAHLVKGDSPETIVKTLANLA